MRTTFRLGLLNILIMHLVLIAGRTMAQENPLRLPSLSFVDASKNALIFAGDRSAWDRYHAKMDQVLMEGTGQVHIAQFGGSHLQADMWSMELRHRLQNMAPGVQGGRGFIFPYNMAKSNNPYWYHPEYTGQWSYSKNTARGDTALGIAGYSVTTTDAPTNLQVSFRGEVYAGYTFNRVKVLHGMDHNFEVVAWSPDSLVHIEQHVDSVRGYTEIEYDRYVDTLHLRFERTDTTQLRFTLHGITLESDDPGFFYHANGVNGASTTSWLRCERYTEELAVIKPDLVVFSIGINDAHDSNFSAERFEQNYAELIERTLKASPNAAILLTTNTDSYIKRRYPNKNGSAVRDVMLRLSAKYGCAVWDTFGVMGGKGSISEWRDAGFAKKDLIHFTRAGYTALGDLLFSAMIEAYGQHVERTFRP